ncbi:chemotaxis protein CheB [Parvularcula maris]|uniref:histidine kinase n=1 Tax=Parvularcula maris TaxID=2965077 RepID=A0A9X2LAB9_9PROT|nr:chemotaxis protein CheB [Parvularcula maris]MCQ8185878.1 PAS domain-containing protein [Parvularcula maris]
MVLEGEGKGSSSLVGLVGIGASAGGLEPLQEIVAGLPPDAGLAYVVVQHLSPDKPSILHQLLAEKTRLPVRMIEDGAKIVPDAIHIAPSTSDVELNSESFRLVPRDPKERPHAPIDRFFSSLARVRGRTGICVVLSGTGTDGTAGLRAVKEAGGIGIAQSSENARFPGMPNAAVATGLVDFVQPARDVPLRLADLASHFRAMSSQASRNDLHEQIEDRLSEITEIVSRTGHDFSAYKPATLIRRIARRMGLQHTRTVDAYLDRLKDDDHEAGRLLQDFLIGVTKFFRDEEVFDLVRERVIEPLAARKGEPVRIWVPGCSTGEEVYSLAMLLVEAVERHDNPAPLQIFGTDIDLGSLAHARSGRYTDAAVQNVPKRLLEQFLAADHSGYRINPRLREICVFSPHNLAQDPPFSRIDFVSCRNLLIYLSLPLQQRVIPRLHFAIRGKGHLLLGPSEGLAGDDDLFETVDKKSRLFRRRADAETRYSALADHAPRPRTGDGGAPVNWASLPVHEATRETKVEQLYLQRFAQPFALIGAAGEVVYLSEAMTAFVRPSRGAPATSIDSFLVPDLRMPVRAALSEAKGKGETHTVFDVLVGTPGERRLFDVTAAPAFEDNQFLLVLSEARLSRGSTLGEHIADRDLEERDLLTRENAALRRQLSAATAEYESSGQELRSSNEELLSMNEELQSSNEELETSREELQSINEELETVNAELTENNQRLARANSDLKNLFESTDIAVLFLDPGLHIRSFTPATTRLFGVRENDAGRPISDFASRVSYPELEEDARSVKADLQTIERELVTEKTGETYLLRMRPYRTTDDRLDGFVLTFFDISERKRTEELLARNAKEMERQYVELETLYDTTPVGLNLLDRNLRYLRINDRLAEINGHPAEAHIGRLQAEMVPDIDPKIAGLQRQVFDTGKAVIGTEVTGYTPAEPDRERVWIVDYYPVRSGEGEVFAIGSCVREITEERALVRKLAASESRLRRILDNMVAFAAVLEPDGTLGEANQPAMERAELKAEEVIGKKFWDTYWWSHSEEVAAQVRGAIERAASGEQVRYDVEVRVAGGALITIDFQVAPVMDGEGEVIELIASGYDITERRAAEVRLTMLLGELQHRVKNTLATVAAISRFLADNATSVSAYEDRLTARLEAISRTHDLLTAEGWGGASLHEVLSLEASPYQSAEISRVRVKGDDIRLDPKEVLSLGMAFHELVTNAAKYGALSTPEGEVTVTVSEGGAEWTDYPRSIVWKEKGGPEVSPPHNRSGFGSFLIEQVLARDLKGEVQLHYEEDGVRCCIGLPDGGA